MHSRNRCAGLFRVVKSGSSASWGADLLLATTASSNLTMEDECLVVRMKKIRKLLGFVHCTVTRTGTDRNMLREAMFTILVTVQVCRRSKPPGESISSIVNLARCVAAWPKATMLNHDSLLVWITSIYQPFTCWINQSFSRWLGGCDFVRGDVTRRPVVHILYSLSSRPFPWETLRNVSDTRAAWEALCSMLQKRCDCDHWKYWWRKSPSHWR